MKRENNFFYALGVANFITALGGGAVLGKAMHVINFSFAQLGSLVAFFFGTALGLFFLFGPLKERRGKADLLIAFFGSISSISLYFIFRYYSHLNENIEGISGAIFFILLCIRFAFWFLSRVLRSDRMALESKRAVPLLEGLFHLGTIVSLTLLATGIISFNLLYILIIDAFSQFFGGIIDWLIYKRHIATQNFSPQKSNEAPLVQKQKGYTAILILQILVFSLLTVMIQVILFYITHLVSTETGNIILASFYLGLAVVGLFGGYLGLHYLNEGILGTVKYGAVRGIKISNLVLIIVSSFSVGMLITFLDVSLHLLFIAGLVFIASITYESLALGVLDSVIQLGENLGAKRIVAKAFSILALVACVAMSLLIISGINQQQSFILLVILFIVNLVIMGLSRIRFAFRTYEKTETVSSEN